MYHQSTQQQIKNEVKVNASVEECRFFVLTGMGGYAWGGVTCSASFRFRAKIENDSWTLLCAFINREEALWDPGCAS